MRKSDYLKAGLNVGYYVKIILVCTSDLHTKMATSLLTVWACRSQNDANTAYTPTPLNVLPQLTRHRRNNAPADMWRLRIHSAVHSYTDTLVTTSACVGHIGLHTFLCVSSVVANRGVILFLDKPPHTACSWQLTTIVLRSHILYYHSLKFVPATR